MGFTYLEASELLQDFFPSTPAQVVTNIEDMKNFAKRKKLLYADYGDAIFIKGLGKFIESWEGEPWSPGQYAKAYMNFQQWPWPLHRGRSLSDDICPALYFRGPLPGDWSYIDLVHAYWQIGQHVPWFTLGPFGGRIRGEEGRFKSPEIIDDLRRPRIVLFGLLAFPGSSTLWVYPEKVTTATCPPEKAKFANRIWAQSVLLVVNAFAQDFLSAFPDSPLFQTDGAFVPVDQEQRAIDWTMERWHLRAAAKEHGSGLVAAPGVYQWRPSFKPVVSPRSKSASMKPLDIEKIRQWWLGVSNG